MQPLNCRTGWPLGQPVLEQASISQNCPLSAAAGWRKVLKRSLPRAPADPSFLLGTSLTTLRKGHWFGNGALNSLHAYRAQGDWRGDQLREGLDFSACPQPKTLISLNTVQGNTHTHSHLRNPTRGVGGLEYHWSDVCPLGV